VRLWNAETGVELRRFDGRKYVIPGATTRTNPTNVNLHFHGLECWGPFVSFSPDGKQLASGWWDNTVSLWDAQSGVELRLLEGHTGRVTSVSFSVDGKRLASGSWDNTVCLWDAERGVKLRRLEGHTDRVSSVSFSAGSHRLASVSEDRTV